MPVCFALFRGINVGGRNKLPMAALRSLLEDLGLEHVRSYIQSGNVVFEAPRKPSAKLVSSISAAIEDAHGFGPEILVLTADDFARRVAASPYAHAEPKSHHAYFLGAEPKAPNLDALEALRTKTEHFELKDGAFYLLAPDGIGRSKLAAAVEAKLGVATTARNGRTLQALLDLVAKP